MAGNHRKREEKRERVVQRAPREEVSNKKMKYVQRVQEAEQKVKEERAQVGSGAV